MATEIVSLVIDMGKLVWDPIKRHGSYLFCYGRNIHTLSDEVTQLDLRRDRVQQDVDAARQGAQVIYREVEEWLTSANNMKTSADGVVDRSKNTECWNGCCWNPVLCYGLGKKAAKNINSVRELTNKGNFDRVAPLPPPPPLPPSPPTAVSLFPNKGFQDSKTTEEMMNSVFDKLKDDRINIIVVHGMGGVGKTTLMKEVAKQAERDKLFNKVIMVTISQTIIIEKIQKEIGEMVGFKFEDDSLSVRAAKLLARLEEEEKLLVILDDLWDKLELSDVGIPCGDANKGCKIVITSRKTNVYDRMIGSQGSQTKGCLIEVKPLLEAESWNLFRAKVGDVVNSNELSKIAEDIVRECKGLPLAIVVLGSALRGQTDCCVWDAVLQQLQWAIPDDIPDMEKEVFQSIRYSYDNLGSENAKLCFLFCCLFPEDMLISPVDITNLMVGEGLIKFTQTLDPEKQVSYLFHNLKASSLLLEGDEERSVKMHDIVRDVAIWIASKKYGFYSRPKVALKEWPTDMESCRRISLQYNEISELPREPMSFPNVHTLLLNSNYNLEMIPEEFFSEMKALKVLDLSSTSITSLPSSLSSLMNLRVLLLRECRHLKDLSGIGALKKSLEVLDLSGAPYDVPTEVGELSNLRSLNLGNTIPSGVISRLTRLEELNVDHGFEDWQPKGHEDGSSAEFAELAYLSRLRSLSVRIKDNRCFQQDLGHNCFQELKTFRILSSDYYWDDDVDATILMIVGSVVPDWAKLLAERAEKLLVHKCPGVEFLHGGLDISITAFSNIKYLNLWFMEDLCRLCQMAPPDGFLANLKNMTVYGCNKLTNIFSSDLISRAHQLEELQVYHCHQLCHVFHYDSALGGESHDPILLPHLRRLHLQSLFQLTSIWEGGVPPQSLGNLRKVSINTCERLKHVFTWGQFPSLALLEELDVSYCDQLCHVFQYDSASGGESHNRILLPHLTTLRLDCLRQLTSIWEILESGVPPQSLGNLRELSIEQCDSLKHVFTWGQFPSLTSLVKLSIEGCDSLKHVFTWGQFRSLELLESLSISNCSGMVAIIMSDEANSEVQVTENNSNVLPRLKLLRLHGLGIARFNEGGVSLFDWPSLEKVSIERCPNLKKLPLSSHGAPRLREICGSKEWFQALEWEDENIKSRLQSLFVSNDLEDAQVSINRASTSANDID